MDRQRIPVIVGVAQLTHRQKTEAQLDPIEMMESVARQAAKDAGVDGLPPIDTLGIVNCVSKPLENPTQQLSDRLRINPSWSGYTGIGATAPQWFVKRFAERIREGETAWGLVCGAEAFYSKQSTASLGSLLATGQPGGSAYVGDVRAPVTPLEFRYGLIAPVHTYALIENALRARTEQTITEQRRDLADFCARLSRTAESNPYAWDREPRRPDSIVEVSDANRMVSFPYTKLMCANMQVNQAAALLMTSMAQAEAAGIAKDKMVFVRGCEEAEDVFHPTERPSLSESPSVREAAGGALCQASATLDEVSYFDLYSCFPSAPRIVLEMLGLEGLPPERLSVTGGMACFGGPGNNYSQHAICTMVGLLREEPHAIGLVHSLSWYLSKHCVGIYSAHPGDAPWRPASQKSKPTPYPKAHVVSEANGTGRVESYSLAYDREGGPSGAIIIGRDENYDRFLARAAIEPGLLHAMETTELIGRSGRVSHDPSNHMNTFALD